MTASQIQLLIHTHLAEATGNVLDCNVSDLKRGESVERDYFIFKIDLARSTAILRGASAGLYARIAHVYLSSIDKITQEWGADRQQTEYHGDSVLAFFPRRKVSADRVLSAAIQAHYAANYLRQQLELPYLRPRLLLHSAALVVAKVGPWSESHRVTIGLPIHHVAKKEKEIEGGAIWLSDEFATQLDVKLRSDYLTRAAERAVANSVAKTFEGAVPSYKGDSLAALMRPSSRHETYAESLVKALRKAPIPPSIGNLLSSIYDAPAGAGGVLSAGGRPDDKGLGVGYFVKLEAAYIALQLPIAALS
jgi:class 3 adenylate cyclase